MMQLIPKIVDNDDLVEMARIYQFRYQCYSVDTDWRPKNDVGVDYDDYEENAIHMALYSPGGKITLKTGNRYPTSNIVAYMRLTPRLNSNEINTFMIEKEYENAIVKNRIGLINTKEVGEISRLCICRSRKRDLIRIGKFNANLMMAQYKLAYQTCRCVGIKHLYFASTNHIIENGRKRGFPIHRMMPLVKLKNGDEIEFVQMHWDEFDERAPKEMVDWFQAPFEGPPFLESDPELVA